MKGGVLIVHQTHEGKHQYEVENVLKYKNVTGGKMFVRYKSKKTVYQTPNECNVMKTNFKFSA